MIWKSQPAAEIIPKRDPQLGTSLGQTEKGIAAVASDIATGTTADFSLGHVTADVTL